VTDLRASDAERERTVEQLRVQAAAGRLTVEELDERCERALAARTRGELATLTADLPSATPARKPAPVDPGGIGRQPFTYVFEHAVTPAAAMEAALRTMAPALGRSGYALVARAERRLEFDYEYRPGWIAIPIILFPGPGFIALLVKEHDRVVVEFEDAPNGGTRMVVRGRAPRRVRRAFAELGS
jgi:Domain of unknown function (DUF1707)